MKKTLIAAAAAIALLVFCGCASESSTTTGMPSSTTTTTMQQTEALLDDNEPEDGEGLEDEQDADHIDYDLAEYTMDETLQGGYSYTATLRIGSWVKASDTEMVNAAWAAVGGKGALPDINGFKPNGYASVDLFEEGTSVYAFGTVSVTDTTEGGFNLSDSSQTPSVIVSSAEIDHSNKLYDGLVEYGGSNIRYTHSIESYVKHLVVVLPDMKSRTWGTVPFAVCVAETLSPEYPDGDPNIMDATWVFGDNEFNVYPMWLDDSEYSESGLRARFCGTWEGSDGSEIEFFEDGTATLLKVRGDVLNEAGTWEKDASDILHISFDSLPGERGGSYLGDGYRSTSFSVDMTGTGVPPFEQFTKGQ